MISQPTRTNRLFARRLALMFSRSEGWRRPAATREVRLREFLTLGHFMAYGEPANFELSPNNLVEEPRQGPNPGNYWSAVERTAS